ncbi:hypothetical protein C1H46_028782 [Malus baccata]|uniref:RPN1 N-terminal domain-containing protein n=1 Tax=Malus baccata TaxID=106549 RepID=A0A540LGJ9_MALBA|nr:hypothetical protein C1H46_028782 [Malus baccata]
MELMQQVDAFLMKCNAEPEAIDLLMLVEDLDQLIEHVDKIKPILGAELATEKRIHSTVSGKDLICHVERESTVTSPGED